MNILLLHRNFPAQFVHIAAHLRQFPENNVVFLTTRKDVDMQGVKKVIFQPARLPSKKLHPFLMGLESAVLEAQAAEKAAWELKTQGFQPDVIYGHSGWGSTLFMKDIFPETPFVGYYEWFYRAHGSDVGFAGTPVKPEDEVRLRIRNSTILLDLYSCDLGVCPTYWQHSQFPDEYGNKLKVLHDGIDTQWCSPASDTKLILPHIGLELSRDEELITYVGRGMEPYRGFPQFMAALSQVLRRRPKAHAIIVGSDKVFYGKELENGKTYKEAVMENLDIDLKRVHFTGHLPKHLYVQVLQSSSVHVYLTVPFVLSWSMLEAMACGCNVVASRTSPVTEVINDGVNGRLVDLTSVTDIAEHIEEALVEKKNSRAIRVRARETILDRYDLKKLLPLQIKLLNDAAGRSR